MHLTTDGQVILRRFRPDDREDLRRLADNHAVARPLADAFPHPYTLADADAWIAAAGAEKRLCNFAVEWREEFAGGIGLMPQADIHAGTALMGYWLGEPYWGRGIATRAVAALVRYAFDELLFLRLQSLVFEDNPASMRVLEKNGFALEGVMRRHVRKWGVVKDAMLYAKVRRDMPATKRDDQAG